MPTIEGLLAFSLMALVLIAVPGPSVLFVIGRSLSLGRRGGLLSVVGNELGGLPLALLVSLGLGSLIAQSVVLFTVIKVLGAAYLVYLGIQAIRHRRDGTEDAADAVTFTSPWKTLGQGFIVGVTNPKTIIFFVAALPQFANLQAGNVALQMIILGLVFTLIALVCDTCWAVLAAAARNWFVTSPKRLSTARGAGGGLMASLGISLMFTPART